MTSQRSHARAQHSEGVTRAKGEQRDERRPLMRRLSFSASSRSAAVSFSRTCNNQAVSVGLLRFGTDEASLLLAPCAPG